jgi:hypothetical protein
MQGVTIGNLLAELPSHVVGHARQRDAPQQEGSIADTVGGSLEILLR